MSIDMNSIVAINNMKHEIYNLEVLTFTRIFTNHAPAAYVRQFESAGLECCVGDTGPVGCLQGLHLQAWRTHGLEGLGTSEDSC